MTNNFNLQNSNDINRLSSIETCIQAQELVQELLNKFSEVNSALKSSIQGITNSDPNFNRYKKLDENLSSIDSIFNKLRIYCRAINQHKIEQLSSGGGGDNNTQAIQSSDTLIQNKAYLIDKITEKNSYIKILIDYLLNIIWQINSLKSLE
jgi:hypothetical protein